MSDLPDGDKVEFWTGRYYLFDVCCLLVSQKTRLQGSIEECTSSKWPRKRGDLSGRSYISAENKIILDRVDWDFCISW